MTPSVPAHYAFVAMCESYGVWEGASGKEHLLIPLQLTFD